MIELTQCIYNAIQQEMDCLLTGSGRSRCQRQKRRLKGKEAMIFK